MNYSLLECEFVSNGIKIWKIRKYLLDRVQVGKKRKSYLRTAPKEQGFQMLWDEFLIDMETNEVKRNE